MHHIDGKDSAYNAMANTALPLFSLAVAGDTFRY